VVARFVDICGFVDNLCLELVVPFLLDIDGIVDITA